LTGFDELEVKGLLGVDDDVSVGDDTPVSVGAYERAKSLTKVVRGDVFELGSHRLMCGDATSAGCVVNLMNGEKADMVFTDPPYNALKSWNKDEANSETRLNPNQWFKNDNMEWDEYKDFIKKIFSNLSGHSAYVCCDFRIYPIYFAAIIDAGYKIKHCIIWKKNLWGLGKRYRFQHEFIIYACKDKAPFYGDRSQSDVWEVDVDRTGEHNTPKPIKLCNPAIMNSSKSEDIVLDICRGSGSTLIACENLNRRCFMMELDPVYVQIILDRWEKHTGKKANKINTQN